MISVITRTYNRADTIERTIKSVLAQDYSGWELIIVNDGSTDNTLEVISKYSDPRIRVINHSENLGMAAAFHTGLNDIRGIWFTLLDSDDEMVQEALTTMLSVTSTIDPEIDAITCNCIDSVTGSFSGTGLDRDQFLDSETIIEKCRGEFWGLTKTTLLPDRNNEMYLGAVWHKINKVAKRYYLHQGLRIYHTENEDRISVASNHLISKEKIIRRYNTFISILSEKEFLQDYKKHGQDFYRDLHYTMGVFFIENNFRRQAWNCIRQVATINGGKYKLLILIIGYLFGKGTISGLKKMKRKYYQIVK